MLIVNCATALLELFRIRSFVILNVRGAAITHGAAITQGNHPNTTQTPKDVAMDCMLHAIGTSLNLILDGPKMCGHRSLGAKIQIFIQIIVFSSVTEVPVQASPSTPKVGLLEG
jgi:hypothetical protein